MKQHFYFLLLLAVMGTTLTVGACGSDEEGAESDGDADTDTDTDTDADSDTGTDSGTDSGTEDEVDTSMLIDQTIGSACTCVGGGCASAGVPLPAAGDSIVGCDDVVAEVGSEVVCLRTYSGDFATDTFFANGYCAVQAIGNCEGADLICSSATFGDVDTLTTCPVGTVMIEMSVEATVNLGTEMTATMDSKVCAKACTDDTVCRTDETDPVLGDAATQYACIGEAGAQFCYDSRNLPADYTATAF